MIFSKLDLRWEDPDPVLELPLKFLGEGELLVLWILSKGGKKGSPTRSWVERSQIAKTPPPFCHPAPSGALRAEWEDIHSFTHSLSTEGTRQVCGSGVSWGAGQPGYHMHPANLLKSTPQGGSHDQGKGRK